MSGGGQRNSEPDDLGINSREPYGRASETRHGGTGAKKAVRAVRLKESEAGEAVPHGML